MTDIIIPWYTLPGRGHPLDRIRDAEDARDEEERRRPQPHKVEQPSDACDFCTCRNGEVCVVCVRLHDRERQP